MAKGFLNLLVPVDFSEMSEPTIEMAVRVAAKDALVTLLHVVEWLPVLTDGAFGVYPHRRDIEQLKSLSRAKLEGYARTWPEAQFTVRVSEGKPATCIFEVAALLRPEIIVIGSHGRSGLDHLLLGSVTERVLRRSDCPVLVVRRTQRVPPAAPGEMQGAGT